MSTRGAKREHVEDLYPLVPTQQGMLFHDLLHPNSGVYVIQVAFTIVGPLDRAAFEGAWRALQARHAVLRTAFAWEKLARPVQVVGRAAPMPIEALDWRDRDASTARADYADWLESDLVRGFDPSAAPLMRVTTIRLSDERTRVVWTYHHMLLDGWSLPLLLGEWITSYAAARSGASAALPEALPYREYVDWLEVQDLDAARRFWAKELEGAEPTHLPRSTRTATGSGQDRRTRTLDAATTERLRRFARDERVTLGTLLQGAFGRVLQRRTDRDDVLFGLARSGRPHALARADERVGLFLNLLPVRVVSSPELGVGDWLRSLQSRFAAQGPFEYAALRDVQAASGVATDRTLFDAILVFENYPRLDAEKAGADGLGLEDIDVREHTNYPLNSPCLF